MKNPLDDKGVSVKSAKLCFKFVPHIDPLSGKCWMTNQPYKFDITVQDYIRNGINGRYGHMMLGSKYWRAMAAHYDFYDMVFKFTNPKKENLFSTEIDASHIMEESQPIIDTEGVETDDEDGYQKDDDDDDTASVEIKEEAKVEVKGQQSQFIGGSQNNNSSGISMGQFPQIPRMHGSVWGANLSEDLEGNLLPKDTGEKKINIKPQVRAKIANTNGDEKEGKIDGSWAQF